LVTGATYNPSSNVLFLIGYSSTLGPFTASFESLPTNTSIFTEEVIKTNLNIGVAQVESIAYSDSDTYFFTSESFSRTSPSITLEPTLFKFDVSEMDSQEPEFVLEEEKIIVYKNRFYDFMEYQSGIRSPIVKRSIFDPLGREIQHISGENIENNRIDLSTLQNGIYYLTFYFSDRKESIPFYKD